MAQPRAGIEGSEATSWQREGRQCPVPPRRIVRWITPTLAIAAQLTCGDGTTEPPADPNRAPEPVGTFANQEVAQDATGSVNVAEYFRDPDGDPLAFSATSSDPGVAASTVAGSVVTIRAVSRGTATVTVTATDPGGLSASQRFDATVPNEGPQVVGAIADQRIEVGDSLAIGVVAHFIDPEGDPLAFSAASSDTLVARAEVDGDSVRLAALAQGMTTVTVAARDPAGVAAAQSFTVTVPNRAPFVAGTIPAGSALLGDTLDLALDPYFADPDGDSLGFSAESSDPAVAMARVTGSTLVVVPVAPGGATVTATASDPEGLSAAQSFEVTVVNPNRAPVAVGETTDRLIYVGATDSLDVSTYFSDPDGDSLTYTAETSRRIRVAVSAHGNVIVLMAVSVGSSTISVTARDPDGLLTRQRFRAVVEPVPTPDLVVGTPMVDGDSVGVGGEFTLTAVVRNQGEGQSTSSTRLRFVHSDNPRITATDSLLGTYPVGQLDTAAMSVGSLMVHAPTTPGTYYYGACVEALENEAEAGNNCSGAASVRVWQPNRGPNPVGTIPLQETAHGDTSLVNLTGYFRDPDGDPLSFAAMSSDTSIAKVAVTGSVAVVRGRSRGTATVTVTATDPGGLSARQEFGALVPNRGPEPTGAIADRRLVLDDSVTIGISVYFTDPEGDSLVFSAESSDSSVASVGVSGDSLRLVALAEGTATVTVTARDPEGEAAEQRFRAIVGPVPAPDLVVESPTVDSDSVKVEGEFKLSAVVRNQGNAEAQSSTLRFYESSDATITSDDSDVGTGPVVTLGTGQASELSIQVTGPSDVGTRFYGACVQPPSAETHTDNNCSAGIPVRFRPPNHKPEQENSFRARSMEPGERVRFGLSRFFTDPDGDSLRYSATSSDSAITAVSVSRGALTIEARALGSATIEVTAQDVTTRAPSGLTATQQFEVTVRLRPRPDLVVGMSVDSLDIGPEQSFILNAVVHNEGTLDVPSGTTVRFFLSSDTTIGTADSERGTAILGPLPESGRQTVSVSLTSHADEGVYYYGACVDAVADESSRDNNCSGALTMVVDELTPPNRAPSVEKTFRDVTDAEPGERYRGPLDGVFADPDDDPLTITAESSDDAVARAEIVGETIYVTTVGFGTAIITVTATDPGGLSASTEFEVTVPAPCTGFCILLGFSGAVADVYKPAIRNAVGFWEAILAGTELPDVDLGDGFDCAGLVLPDGTQVDDHLFIAHVQPIDGPGGTLANAGFCAQRGTGGFPTVSRAFFDAADIDLLVALGMLDDVAFHELAHGLGFIGGHLRRLGLASDDPEPHFTGSGALAAFNAAGGAGYTGAKVPLAPDGHHWSESVFDVEVMTPDFERGVPQPVSAITIQAFADLGYTVNASLADGYTLPSPRPPLLARGQPHRVFDLSDDVAQGPVMILGPDGRVVDVVPAPPGYAAPFGPSHKVTIDLRSQRPVRRPPESLGPLDPAAAAASPYVSWIREPPTRRPR